MTQEIKTLYVQASKLGNYPNYQIDATQSSELINILTCDICGAFVEDCFKRNAVDGTWNKSHSSLRLTSERPVRYVWITLNNTIKTEQSLGKRVKREA